MPERHLPVRPNLEQLRHQAKDLLVGVRKRDASAVAELQQFRTAHSFCWIVARILTCAPRFANSFTRIRGRHDARVS
jgi:hypothetical protein